MTRQEQQEVSDDMLMALADGELDDAQADVLHRIIAVSPELAQRYGDFVETRALLQEAFVAGPVPDRLTRMLQADPAEDRSGVVAFQPRRLSAPARGPVWGMALAASVVLALGGFWIGRGTAPAPVSGPLAVAAALASMPTGAAVDLPDGTTARALASYQTDAGLCRLIGQDSGRHVVCRDAQSGSWSVALSVSAMSAESYLPASDFATGLVDQLLDDLGAGPALTAEQEAAALAR